MIPSRAPIIKFNSFLLVFPRNLSWLVAYVSKHRAGDAHAHTYCKGWPTPVALNLADWAGAKPTGDPCVCRRLGLCIKFSESERERY